MNFEIYLQFFKTCSCIFWQYISSSSSSCRAGSTDILTLSRHSSLSFIALGRSSGQHPVSSHSCWIYVGAGRPVFARPCVGFHKSTSLMSSYLFLQQCPACLVRLTWIVFVIGGRWPYSWCFVGCCRQDLFKIAYRYFYLKMAGKNTGVSTRSKGAIKFSGLLSPLDKTEPPTLRQIIQYSCFLMNTYPHLSCFSISKLIAKEVIDIWQAVNPRLPLLKEISVVSKVKILCFQKARQINRKHLPAAQTKFWKEKVGYIVWYIVMFLQPAHCKLWQY